MDFSLLVKKYNVPGPRYTSYPTVPHWKNDPLTSTEWIRVLQQEGHQNISLYIHLPFCEQLCTFCGCHKRITKNHQVEAPYIEAVLKEWKLYRAILPNTISISEIHLGGGTPTFFAPDALRKLILGLTKGLDLSDCTMGFEAHPNNTTIAHLEVLSSLGFKRISFGIQDYDPDVQKAIHRVQSQEQVSSVHHAARSIGYTINHDLVYGLPFQTEKALEQTLKITAQLKPERIALYSYAHVPWIKGTGQRGFNEADLPQENDKMELYEMATSFLLNEGYVSIGMDHFALPHDQLALAMKNGTLHRNFMGYTVHTSKTMIGLGMSAISDAWVGFEQNNKSVEGYIEEINKGILPVFRGHLLTEKDLEIRTKILDLMCHFNTVLPIDETEKTTILNRMSSLIADGIVEIKQNNVFIPPRYRGFVRNVCMCFDEHLLNQPIQGNTFSKTI